MGLAGVVFCFGMGGGGGQGFIGSVVGFRGVCIHIFYGPAGLCLGFARLAAGPLPPRCEAWSDDEACVLVRLGRQ